MSIPKMQTNTFSRNMKNTCAFFIFGLAKKHFDIFIIALYKAPMYGMYCGIIEIYVVGQILVGRGQSLINENWNSRPASQYAVRLKLAGSDTHYTDYYVDQPKTKKQ